MQFSKRAKAVSALMLPLFDYEIGKSSSQFHYVVIYMQNNRRMALLFVYYKEFKSVGWDMFFILRAILSICYPEEKSLHLILYLAQSIVMWEYLIFNSM